MTEKQTAIIDFDGFADNPRLITLLGNAQNIAISNTMYSKDLFTYLLEDGSALYEWVEGRITFTHPLKEMQDYYGQIVIDFLNHTLGTNLQFISVNTCTDYMVSNDSLNINFTTDDLEKIKTYIDELNLAALFEACMKNASKHRTGYIPFYTREEIENRPELLIRVLINTVWDYVGFEDGLNSLTTYWDTQHCSEKEFVATIDDINELIAALKDYEDECRD